LVRLKLNRQTASSSTAKHRWRHSESAPLPSDELEKALKPYRGTDYFVTFSELVKASRQRSKFRSTDPGAVTAHRWRKKFYSDGKIDEAKIARALDDAPRRCIRINDRSFAGASRRKDAAREPEFLFGVDCRACLQRP
jgi:hypothetical protein